MAKSRCSKASFFSSGQCSSSSFLYQKRVSFNLPGFKHARFCLAILDVVPKCSLAACRENNRLHHDFAIVDMKRVPGKWECRKRRPEEINIFALNLLLGVLEVS
jgi:hypothetical protein